MWNIAQYSGKWTLSIGGQWSRKKTRDRPGGVGNENCKLMASTNLSRSSIKCCCHVPGGLGMSTLQLFYDDT